jgi:hypothetical protein
MTCPDCRAEDYISTQTDPCAWCGFKKDQENDYILQASGMKLWFLSEASNESIVALGENEPDYSALSEYVGGYIEYVPKSMFSGEMFEYTPSAEFQPTWLSPCGSVSGNVLQVIVNEEGKIHGLPRNNLCTTWTHPRDVLVGNVVFQIEVVQ